ncbi:MAG: 2,3-bisphosphoglycerate-independent phosphoglycerate mutase [Candidatus Shapirobacteria bacterium]|nr:2,3-bisphosphoglycerate-independent phosphoglycerate mutase [Candidatus Shapirobacteria bacterium]
MERSGSIVLIILDGWGLANTRTGNAIALANTPNFDKFWASFPHAQVVASGESVGLPKGDKGNSETGHLNIGAGRIVLQDLVRINMSIADGTFFQNQSFLEAVDFAKKNHSALHLMGMIGSAGVHSNNQHLFALLRVAKKNNLDSVFLHLFTDGRDSPPKSALIFLEQVENQMNQLEIGQIASISGRFWAMDRDNRWERTQKAYQAIAEGKGLSAKTAKEAIEQAYQRQETDEFIQPTIINGSGQSAKTVNNNDAVIFFNFRIDRPRQLTKAFVLDLENYQPKKAAFDPYAEKYGQKIYAPIEITKTFQREKKLENIYFVTMTEYEKGLPTKTAFPAREIHSPLAQVISQENKRQFHIAETEKERFVTYYFNGYREQPFAGEEWFEVSSPPVKTYDQKPEMSAFEVTDKVIEKIKQNSLDFLLVNFANPDMVGHTGMLEAGIKACEATDQCLGKIINQILITDGIAIITADHGNAEEMINLSSGEIDTEHSNNPVPFIVVGKQFLGQAQTMSRGVLADIAPSVLKLMNISQPGAMTGQSLI